MIRQVTPLRIVVALLVLAAAAWATLRGKPDGLLHVWFLDVGQGDAILVQTPTGGQILVDGGPSPSALLDELGELLPFWDRSLDLVVLTHPDADHVSGLIALLERYEVTAVMDHVEAGEDGGDVWLSALEAAGVRRVEAGRGTLVAEGEVAITALHPAEDEPQEGNDDSVVLRLDYGEASLLLTGDAEDAAECSMLSAGLPLAARVLKIGHHGSAASTSAAFLAAVRPQLAVISVGADNRFGHPSPELLDRLGGVSVLRTDERGRIELTSDGTRWSVRTER